MCTKINTLVIYNYNAIIQLLFESISVVTFPRTVWQVMSGFCYGGKLSTMHALYKVYPGTAGSGLKYQTLRIPTWYGYTFGTTA